MSLPDNSKPVGEPILAQLIDHLSANDGAVREQAARKIFALGLARVEPSVGGWLADPDLADCFIFDRLDTGVRFPRTTVGVAIEPGTFTQILAAYGSPHLADVPADLDAREFEICIGGTVRLDILTTRDRDADGAIARYLRKHGEGIQQVELSVLNVDRATQLLRERFGLAPVYPRSRVGANRTRVNFFLVPVQQGNKLLIELVEEPT